MQPSDLKYTLPDDAHIPEIEAGLFADLSGCLERLRACVSVLAADGRADAAWFRTTCADASLAVSALLVSPEVGHEAMVKAAQVVGTLPPKEGDRLGVLSVGFRLLEALRATVGAAQYIVETPGARIVRPRTAPDAASAKRREVMS